MTVTMLPLPPHHAKVTENMKHYLLPEADPRRPGCLEICLSAQLMPCQHRCGLAGAKQGPECGTTTVMSFCKASAANGKCRRCLPQMMQLTAQHCRNALQCAAGRGWWWFPVSEYCGCISQAGVHPRILILVLHFCKNFFHGCRHRSPFRDRLCSKSESLEWI